MKEKNQNIKQKNKKGIKLNKKVIAIGTTAILALWAIIGVYLLNRDNNLTVINPEIARSMTYDQVQEGDENIEGTNEHVKFDAFFLRDLDGDGYAESIRGTCREIGEEDTLYMELNVQTNGYLENGVITINSDNFYLQTNLPKDDQLADNYVGSNIKEIRLNQINNGTQKLITGIVRSGDYSYSPRRVDALKNNINNYSKVNSVTLTGTYVYTDEGGTEQRVDINKTVEFNIDWHGEIRAEMPSYIANSRNLSQEKDINEAIDEEAGTFTVEFRAGIQEVNNQLLLSKAYIEGEIPELQGYAPTSVEITGTNVTYTYDETTRKFTAQREARVDSNGNITSQAYEDIRDNERYNRFDIKVTYPIEAYEAVGGDSVEYRVPITGYYEGYNNQAEEFTNPYQSNTVQGTFIIVLKNPQGTVARVDVIVGKSVSSPTYRYMVSKQKPLRIYNGISEEETEDTYQVRWEITTGSDGESTGVVLKETQDNQVQVSDQFIKTDNTEESMENVATNVGIGFSGASNMLKEDGWIKVYDEESGNLLVTFTKDDWNRYTSSNPYMYELPVKHIRIETSDTNADSGMYVYNVKKLDDEYLTNNYAREEFDDFQYIKSTLVGYIGGMYINTDTHQANYENPYSIAGISISNNTLSTQTTEENDIITITADANTNSNQEEWQNGMFLIKFPEEILSVEINNVEISNSNVNLESYELIEQDGQNFIKIVTSNETATTYTITVDVDLAPDPRIATMTRNIELYASNENTSDYYYKSEDIYDVNNNSNTTEQVNYRTTSISMVSPNSLLTSQTASEYDDIGSIVVSPQIADLKPIYAVVDQEQEEQTIKVGVQIKNNYASTISEIQILGKIPFEGNTYVLSGGDLGSTFTTKMTDTGIELPTDLQNIATVYYSSNENPDRDINNEANGWQTAEEVTNWDEVKTFLINLNDYVMPTGQEYVFYYTIKIPNGLEFNQTAFSHHGVYFCLDTDEGKYRTQTEPNKLGFRIAEKYDLELTKYQTDEEKLIPGASYSVQEIITNDDGTETKGESKTGVTNASGKLTITNLYAEKTYELREIKSPEEYALNQNVIRFIGHVNENGELTIELTGERREGPEVTKVEGENYKVTLGVEDEIKARLSITKKDVDTGANIEGIKYKLTGGDLGEEGTVVRTNSQGQATLTGIVVNAEYTLEEVKANGYYIASPIKFKIVKNDNVYSMEIIEGSIVSQSATEDDEIPVINIELEDEKIPTYNLQLIKVKKTIESTLSENEQIAQAETTFANTEIEYLQGAKFRLYKGTEEIGTYETGEDGTILIEGLYQYESEKDIDQTYTLKEVMAPEGYAKVKDISFRVQEENGSLILIDENGEERNYTVEGDTVKLTIEDSPSFKLIKKDAETKEAIGNVKFVIYNVEGDSEEPARNSKGEIVGTLETINGTEYYTVQTDSNGELTVDLPEGLYKAVEVEAPEQYEIVGQTYYFGIGGSREGGKVLQQVEYGEKGNLVALSGINPTLNSTSDGGYIASGYLYYSHERKSI